VKVLKGVILSIFFFIPLYLHSSEFEVKIIKSASDLPEQFCSVWKKGDYLVTDGKFLILIGGTARLQASFYKYPIENMMGSILGFGPKETRGDLMIGSPMVKVRGRMTYVGYSSVELDKQNLTDKVFSFRVTANYEGQKGEKAHITTSYQIFNGTGRVDVFSTIENTGSAELGNLEYSLYFRANQIYSFSPFDKETHPDLPFWVYPKKGHYVGWIDLNPLKDVEEPVPLDLAPGKSYDLHYILLADSESTGVLDKTYQILGYQSANAIICFSEFNGDLMELIIRDSSSSVFFRAFLEKFFPLEVTLPEGIYTARANFFPTVREEPLFIDVNRENRVVLKDLPKGSVKVKIRDRQGNFIPGKVTFIGMDPTKTPYFQPLNPLETGNYVESFKNSCYPGKDGEVKELPVGTYITSASRGPEYTLDQKVIEVLKDRQQELVFQIDKVIDTDDLISVDPHLHTLDSDGSVTIADRIKSVVAEGVDVAISTDHNFISDYSPTLKKLGMDDYLAVINGIEISGLDVNAHWLPDFAVFPVTIDQNKPNNGALSPISEGLSVAFDKWRKKDSGALIQVCHPRGWNSYFHYFELDPETAATVRKDIDMTFDLLEAMNGPSSFYPNSDVIKDWLNLLNRGYYFPIVGCSDSHEIDRNEPGYSRTYVIYDGAEGPGLDPEVLLGAMKKGRSFISTGPVVQFTINGQYLPGDSITVRDGKVEIGIKVQSAPWIAADEVRLIINGERKIVLALEDKGESVVKFQDSIHLDLEKDAYIVVEVLGKKSLYPVVQGQSEGGLPENAILPYALTNPIFVDVDGNNRFDPPAQEKIRFVSKNP